MSSKRRIRRRSCTGKIRHADRAHAVQHMLGLRRRSPALLNVYRCPFCKGWHVGRAPDFARAASGS